MNIEDMLVAKTFKRLGWDYKMAKKDKEYRETLTYMIASTQTKVVLMEVVRKLHLFSDKISRYDEVINVDAFFHRIEEIQDVAIEGIGVDSEWWEGDYVNDLRLSTDWGDDAEVKKFWKEALSTPEEKEIE